MIPESSYSKQRFISVKPLSVFITQMDNDPSSLSHVCKFNVMHICSLRTSTSAVRNQQSHFLLADDIAETRQYSTPCGNQYCYYLLVLNCYSIINSHFLENSLLFCNSIYFPWKLLSFKYQITESRRE